MTWPRLSALVLWRTFSIVLLLFVLAMARYGVWPPAARSWIRLMVDLIVIFCWLTPAIGTFYILRHLRAIRRDVRMMPRGDA